MAKQSCSNFRVITANFSGVRIFRIFMVWKARFWNSCEMDRYRDVRVRNVQVRNVRVRNAQVHWPVQNVQVWNVRVWNVQVQKHLNVLVNDCRFGISPVNYPDPDHPGPKSLGPGTTSYKQGDLNWAASWQNQQNGMCAQSDQSLCCPHEESLGPYLPIERTVKTLIRLGGYPGWSESSLCTYAILLVLSWGGSIYCKNSESSETQKHCSNHPKIWTKVALQ